jgi:uncharacterized protein
VDTPWLIEALTRPEAYPHRPRHIEIRQTHISVVALAGAYAYKVKKPVDLGFLDFTTLEKRLHYCHEEVRLNLRLAPDVYLGVVPLVRTDGGLRVEGSGTPEEYAVKMRRLPEEATLLRLLECDELDTDTLAELGRRVAGFHRASASGAEIDRCGRWKVVAGNARENLTQSRGHVGTTLTAAVYARLEQALERELEGHRLLIERRAAAHVPRDTHGDLHLDHVYHFPELGPPHDFVIIDCIEFNERFRYADPVADMAFMAMDLAFRGRQDLERAFVEAYFDASGDRAGRTLLSFYVAYRAAVRAKVAGMTAAEPEVPEAERRDAIARARGYWLLALSQLEIPEGRPALVLVGGLPGTGKSTLAELLGRECGFEVVSSDRVRKELAGLSPETPAAAAFGEGIYTPEWHDRTYAACLERAEAMLFEGKRVIVDASFREAHRRRAFLEASLRWGVRPMLFVCTASGETVRKRMAARRGGASDADWAVYRAAAAAWEHEPDDHRWSAHEVATDVGRDEALRSALGHLRRQGLAAGSGAA